MNASSPLRSRAARTRDDESTRPRDLSENHAYRRIQGRTGIQTRPLIARRARGKCRAAADPGTAGHVCIVVYMVDKASEFLSIGDAADYVGVSRPDAAALGPRRAG